MVFGQEVKKGVILAAGVGDRLGSLTLACPKVLLPIKENAPLITYPIQALAAAGIEEIAIVVGYLSDKVIEALGNGSNFGVKLQYIHNSDYLSGNAISVYRAEDWAQGASVVLCMGDHVIEEKLVKHLLDTSQTLDETLCVDYTPAPYHQLDEATKVTVDNTGAIKDIGKELVRWDALDTGFFLLTENFFRALHELVNQQGADVEITDVIKFLINRGNPFNTCDVSSYFWIDVDTEEDLNVVRE